MARHCLRKCNGCGRVVMSAANNHRISINGERAYCGTQRVVRDEETIRVYMADQ